MRQNLVGVSNGLMDKKEYWGEKKANAKDS